MNRTPIFLLAATLSGTAAADTISHVVDFDINGFEGGFVNFERFDDMGGTRELIGMSLSYDQRIEVDVNIESNGYTALAEGDWELQIAYNSLHQFGLASDPNPPFIGPGAVFNGFSAALGASDGFNGTGPDSFLAAIDESFVFNADYDGSTDFGQRMLDTFSGGGTLETFFGGFSELFFAWNNDPNWIVDPDNPPDGPFGPFQDPYYGIFATFERIQHSGAITVNYEYANVPAPSGLLALSGAGLMVSRRRRR